MRNKIEKYYPIFLSIIVTYLFFRYKSNFQNVEEIIKKLLDTALAICGALLGFLLTILTLINTIDTRRMQFVKSSGYYSQLTHYLKMALYFDLICISIYFFLPILFSLKSIINDKDSIYTLIVMLVSFTWFVNIRFSIIFIKLMSDPEIK